MVKDGAVVIDVGINRMDDGKLVGDTDFENMKEKSTPTKPWSSLFQRRKIILQKN